MAYVIDKDLGWKRIKTKMNFINGKELKVGVLWSAGTNRGVDIAYYACVNEYGTKDGRIPSRPFMATTADEQKMWGTPVTKAINRIFGGREIIAELNDVGEKMKTDIKKNIGTHRFKPLASSTVKKKGHDIQLIDSGALLDSIDYEVK